MLVLHRFLALEPLNIVTIMSMPASTSIHFLYFQVKLHSWGQQRCFAEAAVAPKFDWDSLESSIASEAGKRDLASLRSVWIDVQQKFDSMSQVSCVISDQPDVVNAAAKA